MTATFLSTYFDRMSSYAKPLNIAEISVSLQTLTKQLERDSISSSTLVPKWLNNKNAKKAKKD